ncbi:MAG: galactose-1-phosphate uridylyltransferase, partial [Candidatus Limnocylindrales bacterium]
QADWMVGRRRPLLLDYLARELETGERLVCANDHFVVVVPFWAAWPFETLIVARAPASRLADVPAIARERLAAGLVELLARCDNLFRHPFPYSFGWHQAPFGGEPTGHWQLHAHVYPPLLRSASVRKFMVGYELLAETQRDLTAEEAAERLRALPAEHHAGPVPG